MPIEISTQATSEKVCEFQKTKPTFQEADPANAVLVTQDAFGGRGVTSSQDGVEMVACVHSLIAKG